MGAIGTLMKLEFVTECDLISSSLLPETVNPAKNLSAMGDV